MKTHPWWIVVLNLLLLVGHLLASDVAPTAVISTLPHRGHFYSGEVVVFDGSESYDNDEGGYRITGYDWYIDGHFVTSEVSFDTVFVVPEGQDEITVQAKLRVLFHFLFSGIS